MSINYERVCRLCLSSRGEKLPVFSSTSSDLDPPILATKIEACVSVQICEGDALPTQVCKKCVDNVNNWHTFKEICEKAQVKLGEWLNHVQENNHGDEPKENVEVKSEPEEGYGGIGIDVSYPEFEQINHAERLQPEGPPILASLGLAPRQDKKSADPRLDWERVEAILKVVEADEVIDALKLSEETDFVDISDRESNTDGELASCSDEDHNTKLGYRARDGKIWSKMPKRNISKYEGRKRRNQEEEQHYPKPEHAWGSFITPEMLEHVVECTNAHIQYNSQQEELSADTSLAEAMTSRTEIEALIGILYIHGVVRSVFQQRMEMWKEDGFGLSAVINCMTQERFNFLLENLRFDKSDELDMLIKNETDALRQIRSFIDNFAQNCRDVHQVGDYVVVDERVEQFLGPCPFRKKILRKPIQTGIKMLTLVDSDNFYTSNLEIVIGQGETDQPDAVKRLVSHLENSNTTVVIDHSFVSLKLMKSLYREYNLYTLAAVSADDPLVPAIFRSKCRDACSVMTAFLDDTVSLTSYVTKKLKVTNVITTKPSFYKRTFRDPKIAVSTYKMKQSSAEVLDVLTYYYTTAQHTNSWALSLFFSILNIAAVNAQVVWLSGRSGQTIQRRLFIQNLAGGLMSEQLRLGGFLMDPELPEHVTRNISLKRSRPCAISKNVSSVSARFRCKLCVRVKRDRKTQFVCMCCSLPICREHQAVVCVYCASKLL